MKRCYIACLSRGGSNLLAAIMHNNPAIYAVAKRDWCRFYKAKKLNSAGILKHVDETKKSIYFRGGFHKDLSRIEVLMLDKFLEKDFGFGIPKGDQVLGLIRNPFAVVNSMHRYGQKYKFKEWVMNPAKAQRVIKNRFIPLIRYCNSHKAAELFWFDDLIESPNRTIEQISGFLGINPHTHKSFAEVFDSNGCVYCGSKFTTKISDCSDASNVLLQRGLKYKPSGHFFCPCCKLLTLGYGSFNPHKELNEPAGWHELPGNLKKQINAVLTNRLGRDAAAAFIKGSVTTEMLRSL